MTDDLLGIIYAHEHNNGASGGGVANFLFLNLLECSMTFIKMKGPRKYSFHFQSSSAVRLFFFTFSVASLLTRSVMSFLANRNDEIFANIFHLVPMFEREGRDD